MYCRSEEQTDENTVQHRTKSSKNERVYKMVMSTAGRKEESRSKHVEGAI